MPRKSMVIIILFVIAFLLRFLLVPNPGFEADISFWKSWGLATYDKGIVEGMKVSNNNYPTPFAYTLGSMVWIYSLFKDPHNFNQFWTNTNLLFLTISKLYPILADLGIAAFILFIGKNAPLLGFPSLPLYPFLSIFYLFNPVSLMGGAWWGQVDSLGVFVFLIACILALKRQPFLAGLIYMAAVMTKLQNMIYGPLFFLFVWQITGFDGLMKAAIGSFTAFLGLNVEFFLTRNMDRVMSSLTVNYDYFPLMSLNAFNLWWIVSGAHGMQVSDKIAVLGITNAKTIGLYLFASFYLLAVLRQLFRTKSRPPAETSAPIQTFLEGLIIINAAFFLFQTQSHDRYAFPLIVFLLLAAPFWIERGLKMKTFIIWYGIFSLLYFYNLNTAMIFNYPNNGLPILSSLTGPAATIAVSVVFLGLFAAFGVFLKKQTLWFASLSPLAVFVLLVIKSNLPILAHTPILLTKFTPIASRQDFGTRQTDMSVNSSFGIKSWNRLSVQYAFYQHGIGTHANSSHVFDINRQFRRLTTDYGIDTEAGPKGSAVFEIYGDNKLLFRSEKMTRYELPRHADVDIRGVKLLSLVTTDAGDGNIDDHTDWLNPILTP